MRDLILRYARASEPMRHLCRLLLERPDGITNEDIAAKIGIDNGSGYIGRLSRRWKIDLERDWFCSIAFTETGQRSTRLRIYRLTDDGADRLERAIVSCESIGL